MGRYDDRERDRDRDNRDRDDGRHSRDDGTSYRDRDRDDDRRETRSRGRDDRDDGRDRGRSRDRDRDDDRRGGRAYEYRSRTVEEAEERGSMGNQDYDKLLKPGTKLYKAHDGDNRVRLLPPTWDGAKHYGYDVWVHYNVGPDRASYLCPNKHGDGNCPICAERNDIRGDNDADEKYVKELEAKRRVLVYLVDRDAEREGEQAWFMPQSLDKDIVKVSVDKDTREVLPIDHPEDGYDIIFEKSGSKLTTKYEGVQIARRPSPLGKRAWLENAMDNPLPDQLKVFPSDHIAKAFSGRGTQRDSRDRDDDRDSRRRREDDDDRPRGRDRDREDRDRDRRRDDDRDDDRGRRRDRDDEPTWASVHKMTRTELEDLIELKRLPIKPREAKDTDDLADWVCEEMKLEKPRERARDDDDRKRDDDDRDRNRNRDEGSDRMREMRRRREV